MTPNMQERLEGGPDRRAGVVLCGGLSTRMGRPKASLKFGTESVLQRIVRVISAATDHVVVVGAATQQPPDLPDPVTFVTDIEPEQGPLAGLLTALNILPVAEGGIFVSGCDAPLIKAETVNLLFDRLSSEADAAVIHDGVRYHPLTAVYRPCVLTTAQALYLRGERSLQALLRAIQVARVDLDDLRTVDPTLESLSGMNTEEEYQRLLTLAGFHPDEPPPRILD